MNYFENEQTLFGYAVKQLEEANISIDKWAVGGGTVLKYYLQHRQSKDIDIFLQDPQYLGYLSPHLNDANIDKMTEYVTNANCIQMTFPEGGVDFIIAAQISDHSPQKQKLHGKEVFVEDPVEIVAKKMWYRALDFHVRDLYDLACLYRSERSDDIIKVGATMPDKIAAIKDRIGKMRDDVDFGKSIILLERQRVITADVMDIVGDYLSKVGQMIPQREIIRPSIVNKPKRRKKKDLDFER